MIIFDDEGFYFDRLHILSRIQRQELIYHFPYDKLIAECRSLMIINTDFEKSLYRSRMEVIAPTAEFLRALHENEALFGDGYKISKMEIAHDTFCENTSDAERKTNILFPTLRKKYSFSSIFNGNPNKPKKDRLKDRSRGLFAEKTFYSSFDDKQGGRRSNFKYVLYARWSKINDKPCVHEEWRIAGAGLIARKTGIRDIGDLVRFDFRRFFDKQNAKYIVHESINYEALGLWLTGFDGRRVLTRRQWRGVQIRAQQFLLRAKRDRETYSDLVLLFKDEKKRISEKRGARSEWDKKVMALKDCRRFIA